MRSGKYSMSYAQIMHAHDLVWSDTLIRVLEIFVTRSHECNNILWCEDTPSHDAVK